MSIIHTKTIIITPPHVKISIYMTWENYFLNQMMYVSLSNTTTDVTYGAGDANTSGAPEFTTGFSGFCALCFVDRCLSFFDLLIQIWPLFVSSNTSSFTDSFIRILHSRTRQAIGTIVWRSKVCRGNLQHVKVWNDKLTSYIPTSCGFQQIFMFSLLLKPCLYGVDEYSYLYFKKLLHNSLKW
jgi:hypothetical protein